MARPVLEARPEPVVPTLRSLRGVAPASSHEPTDKSFRILRISKELFFLLFWSVPHPDTNSFGIRFPPRAVAGSRATAGPDRSSSPPPSPGQGPPGRPAPPGGWRVGFGSVRGASPALWPEAGRGSYVPRSTPGTFGSAAFSCSHPRPEPPAPPGSQSNSRSVLPDSCPARVGRRRRFRGRNPSRRKRVSRDRRPARGPRRGRTRSPGLVGPPAVPNRWSSPKPGPLQSAP